MINLKSIASPMLLIDEQRCRSNISVMAEKAHENGVSLRPHFKTHQSSDIGNWFREAGVEGITVSSVDMAHYFTENGWGNITIAFPVNIREIKRIDNLAKRINVSLLVSDEAVIRFLDENLTSDLNLYIEIDTGGSRTGLTPLQLELLDTLTSLIIQSPLLKFRGFYSHPGHSYGSSSAEEVLDIHRDVLKAMKSLNEIYPDASICIGDTPCCSVADHFPDIDEISPGNFVFYDLMQTLIGSCNSNQIAVALAAPVVAKQPGRNEITVHGGAVHLSKDYITINDNKLFGIPVILNEKGWSDPLENSYVASLSQEHGIIKCTPSLLNRIQLGDLIGILPVHSCLTADLMAGYTTLSGEKLDHLRSCN